ncbi:MAG TPA: T9SS type A sorting domain-containing protein [Cytophagaceae bacterium]|nr:T9SS type A sorting domain-containing protein [Cytophagaceae bacterium]
MKTMLFAVIFLVGLLFPEITYSATKKRGLWVWNDPSSGISIINMAATETYKLINQCKADGITDIYLWSTGLLTGTNATNMRTFISAASCNNIRVWALDGDRSYFTDDVAFGGTGPAVFYNNINQVIAYNTSSLPSQRFVGVHGDNEPQDAGGFTTFHDGLADSQLSTTAGTGVWQSTQKLDREYLMRGWLDITKTAYNTCHANSLLYGQDMPSWMDDYYSPGATPEPVSCTYNAIYQPVYYHMMQYLDVYSIMSYSTTPGNATTGNTLIWKVNGELTYASSLAAGSRPEMWAGVETHQLVGWKISYWDYTTANGAPSNKNSKPSVWTDIATIEATLNTYSAYSGMNIHDWFLGYRDLPPISSNTANPGCTLPVELISFEGKNEGATNITGWATAQEKNNEKFELQRSCDGISFQIIANIAGAGNSSVEKKYFYIDNAPCSNISYYRLKQYDYDGLSTTSNIISVSSEPENSISVFPNPAKENLHIKFNSSDNTDVRIDIYNANGKLCYSSEKHSANEDIIISLSDLSPAIYFVKVQGLNNTFSVSKKIQVY